MIPTTPSWTISPEEGGTELPFVADKPWHFCTSTGPSPRRRDARAAVRRRVALRGGTPSGPTGNQPPGRMPSGVDSGGCSPAPRSGPRRRGAGSDPSSGRRRQHSVRLGPHRYSHSRGGISTSTVTYRLLLQVTARKRIVGQPDPNGVAHLHSLWCTSTNGRRNSPQGRAASALRALPLQ